MKENKYFTPEISDIRVGYEGEYHNWCMDELGKSELNYDRWEKAILTKGNVETMLKYGVRGFRVSYLTKEQIEAEGWDFIPLEFSEGKWQKNQFTLNRYADNTIEIAKFYKQSSRIKEGWSCIFMGECKDINTFRYISKLLGINATNKNQ